MLGRLISVVPPRRIFLKGQINRIAHDWIVPARYKNGLGDAFEGVTTDETTD